MTLNDTWIRARRRPPRSGRGQPTCPTGRVTGPNAQPALDLAKSTSRRTGTSSAANVSGTIGIRKGVICLRPEVIVQADDILGSSLLFRWWLDSPSTPQAWWDDGSELLDELDAALPNPAPGEPLEDALARALVSPLVDLDSERDLMRRLGASLLPEDFQTELWERFSAGTVPLIRVVPSPTLVRVPWELLILGSLPPDAGETRLGLIADVVGDAPPAFHVGRARLPASGEGLARVVSVIDPDLGLPGTRLFTDEQRRRLGSDDSPVPGSRVDSLQLSRELLRDPAALAFLFVGHVTTTGDRAGMTALRLSPVADANTSLSLSAKEGALTATDLVLGTALLPGAHSPTLGANLWPMPPRVGIVACNSGSDLGRLEPFGLVIASLNAGASFAIGTRWVLPADRAFRAGPARGPDDPQPLTDLAVDIRRVLIAHRPIEELGRVRSQRIRYWDAEGAQLVGPSRAAASPLTWGAISAVIAPARRIDSAEAMRGSLRRD